MAVIDMKDGPSVITSAVNVPTMLSLLECSQRTGLSYDELRRLCLTGKVAHLRVGSRGGKFLVNFENLVKFLNTAGMNK